jgi:hypothetical protein
MVEPAKSALIQFRPLGVADRTIKEKPRREAASSSDSENEAEDDECSPPPPEITTRKGLSTVLDGIRLPKNPLSDIGDPSENRLLRITNSPNVGALTEVSFT